VRGLCANCYANYRRHDKPFPLPPSKGGSLDQRVAQYADRVGDCLVWRWKDRPKVTINGRKGSVARLVWEQAHGPIPDGGLVLHRCGNSRCVEVSHLYLGDYFDNVDDSRRHGTIARGVTNGHAKLTDDDVRAIRQDDRVQRVIAADYGVSQSVISIIKLRKRWTHVPD
jgi:outer membrane receptor protein involved in Fe transport